jgi:large subunit ribosomal protein L11
MMDFINPFNEATKDMMGKDVIVHIQVFEDRTFAWKSLGQPVDDMIREKIGIKKRQRQTAHRKSRQNLS